MVEFVQRRRIFVFSHARTCSNLFLRLLESHPALGVKLYPFMYAMLWGPESPSRRTENVEDPLLDELKEKYSNATFQSQLQEFECAITEIEAQGKILVVKEHPYHMMYPHITLDDITPEDRPIAPIVDNLLDLPEAERNVGAAATPLLPIPNPTFLPDRLFVTFTPILTIRHPCRLIPSLKRAMETIGAPFPNKDSPWDTQFKWQRMVYDCYKAWFSTPEGIEAAGGASIAKHLPIVVDGDKLVNDPQGQMETLCQILELDPFGIQYSWDVRDSIGHDAFAGTLSKSTGIIKGKDGSDRTPELDVEMKKWTNAWGEETANGIEILVNKMMEDYEYLFERSI
ncbi:hypothetical protein E1B28_002299 [Marasmius oreades]|uniref:Sulfotransferase n=1 Tax=Marasmius oreades TaxID=181124 RepID=A0A9P7RMS4_9AGAR|nr:uncharacterized protein E1B28_002299 [Marasmius oreades]KAG7086337.1 hypothetical protein E1B28_002299 [Marasmius oreades]